MTRGPLHGVVAAGLTPLRDGGNALDLDAVPALVEFYVDAGLDGMFVGGTTGESLLLRLEERAALAESVIAAAAGRFSVAVSAGAQSTADTVELARRAAQAGASCVAAAPPPFFALDETELSAHLEAAARACAPLPFYLYEIRQRTGYAIPVTIIERLRERCENLVGMKVSDPTLEEVERYLATGLEIMVGAEALVIEAISRGAVGAVSGVAGALPRQVRGAITQREGGEALLVELRDGLERFPFHASAKAALIAQGVAIEPWVRPPLRCLARAERAQLDAWLAGDVLGASAAPGPR